VKSFVPQVVKKIAPKTVTDGKLVPVQVPRDLFDVFGVTTKIKIRNTVNATWFEFIGEFEALTAGGDVYRSRRCQLPPPFEEELFSQLMNAQYKDPKASVEFAVRVSVVPPVKGKPSAVGYEYRVTPLVESRDTNPLALLKETAYKSHPALGHEKGGVRAVGGLKR
jgi:hypothetical protein